MTNVGQDNLPTAFWGRLGPQKDVTVNFIKTVNKHQFLQIQIPEYCN